MRAEQFRLVAGEVRGVTCSLRLPERPCWFAGLLALSSGGTAALSSGPALLGVRSAGGGTQQVGRGYAVRRTPLSCARLFPAQSNRRGRRENASLKGEASVTLKRTSSSPCQSADHRLGSPKGSGAPLPSGPGSLQYSFRTDPRAGARPLVLRLESGPLPSSLRPSSRPKVTSPPPSGFSRPLKPCCCWLDKVQLQKASQL